MWSIILLYKIFESSIVAGVKICNFLLNSCCIHNRFSSLVFVLPTVSRLRNRFALWKTLGLWTLDNPATSDAI